MAQILFGISKKVRHDMTRRTSRGAQRTADRGRGFRCLWGHGFLGLWNTQVGLETTNNGEFQPVETALNAAQGGIMGCEHPPDAEVQQFFLVCAFSLPQKTPASPEKCPEFSHQNRWKNVDLHPSYAI